MKKLAVIGFGISVVLLLFSCYLFLIVAPAADIADAAMSQMRDADVDNVTSVFLNPEYSSLFETYERKLDYGIYLFFASMLSFVLCIIPVFKKENLAIIGTIFSLIAFVVGAAYGTHLFS